MSVDIVAVNGKNKKIYNIKTQLSNAILYAFYGIIAIVAVALTVMYTKELYIAIGAGMFCVVGIYAIVKAFKRKQP